MELRHLRYFLTLCETLNFTKAAERLMIAQPPLSRQIKDLEEELGTPLFVREHHQLKLTEEGHLFKDYANRIINLADKSMEDIKEMSTGLKGNLYIACVEGKAPHLLSTWISSFSSKYPDVQYQLWNGNSDEVTKRIQKGLSDVAIIVDPYEPTGLHSFHVYKEPWIALFSAEHPLANIKGKTISLEKLSEYELILPSRSSREQEITDWFEPYNKELKIKARIAHALNAYELCEQNVGVAIFPQAACDLIRENKVVSKIIDPIKEAKYSVIYSSMHPLSPVANKFIDFIKDNFIAQ